MTSDNKSSQNSITKADLVDKVYSRLGFSKKECYDHVEVIFDVLKETITRGENIKISGFGKFSVQRKKERMGRNPQTGNRMKISQRKVLTFKPSQVIKNTLNSK